MGKLSEPVEVAAAMILRLVAFLAISTTLFSGDAPAGLESLRSALSSKVQNLVSSHDGMNAVMNFSNNPDMKAVLNDPQVMQAIQNGDYNALMTSPAMKRLLDNPQTQSLIQSVLKPQGATQPKTSAEKPAALAE